MGASRRCRKLLEGAVPDLVVFEIGVNDILLPYMASRGGLWAVWARHKERRGCLPITSLKGFREQYTQMVQFVKSAGCSQVLLTTLTCIGEQLSSPLNQRREALNRRIRDLAVENQVVCSDVGRQFDRALRQAGHPSPYLIPSVLLGISDVLFTRVERFADVLSRSRGLQLTIDGIHLNRRGADLAARIMAGGVAGILQGEKMKRYFTLEEANRVVDLVRPILREVLEIRQAVVSRQPEVWPVLEKAAGNGGSKSASQIVQEFERLDNLVRQIQASGAEIKDINSGLVDFLSLREGREVYLCWQFGEEKIQYWHDLDTGFAGRQPI